MKDRLKGHLKNHTDDIKKCLKHFGFKNITVNNLEIRCSKPNGNNATTCRVKFNDYLSASDFSQGIKGDLFTLIETHSIYTYFEVIDICSAIIDDLDELQEQFKPFDGFFEDVYEGIEETELPSYDEDLLNQYGTCWNTRFLKDYIKPRTQLEFGLGFDESSKRITIPYWDVDGRLVGVMGRINSDEKTSFKYYPLLKFEKHKTLYGIWQNKEFIRRNRVYIGEAEKFVLQLASYGYRNSVSLGGNAICQIQIDILLSLGVTEIVFCYDEGLDPNIIKQAIITTKNSLFLNDDVKVGVLLDKKNEIIPKDSKGSPSDFGKEAWEKLINKHIRFVK